MFRSRRHSVTERPELSPQTWWTIRYALGQACGAGDIRTEDYYAAMADITGSVNPKDWDMPRTDTEQYGPR